MPRLSRIGVPVLFYPGFFVLFLLLAAPSPSWALSTEDQVRIGRQVMQEVRSMNLTEDPSLRRVGERLTGVVRRKDLPWRFWVVEDWKTYNAFAAPGGFVFITRTYYEKLNDDEAAFVIGHEMAHVDLDHYQRQVRRARQADLGSLVVGVITGWGSGWRAATDIGATAYMTHYSRAMEKQADLTGYQYAQAAGYNASLAVTALSKLGDESKMHPWIINVYGTHPLLSSREDRLAAMGGHEPKDITSPGPSPEHKRDPTGGLEPFDPPVPIAVRILAPDGKRWENAWRKNLTKRLHLHLTPHGFSIAGDDLMYKPDIGDPVEAARSRKAQYLLLVTVNQMSSAETGKGDLAGTPVSAALDISARLLLVGDGSQSVAQVPKPAVVWEKTFSQQRDGSDVLPVDKETLYTDTCLGSMVDGIVAQIAHACAKAAGAGPAKPAEAGEPAEGGKPKQRKQESKPK
jgi:Zn-dependent protease with chaperone function